MKESEDKFWKEEILKDFEKPTHQGFTEDVMQGIDQVDAAKSTSYEPLISPKQWLVTVSILATITIVAIFFQYKIQFNLGYFEKYSQQLLEFLNENTAMLWVSLSLVSVFFVFSLFGKGILYRS
tara:strand:+ start:87 stop:458 length:372 start_codon:yes stop_codon:yes gene_type:complete